MNCNFGALDRESWRRRDYNSFLVLFYYQMLSFYYLHQAYLSLICEAWCN